MEIKTLLVILIVCASVYFMIQFQSVQTKNSTLEQENQTLKLVVPMLNRENTQPAAAINQRHVHFQEEERKGPMPQMSAEQSLRQQFEASGSNYSMEDTDPAEPLAGHDNDRPPMIGYDRNIDPRTPNLRYTNAQLDATPPRQPPPPTHRAGRASPFSAQHRSLMEPSSGYGIQASLADRGNAGTIMQEPIAGLVRNEPDIIRGEATDRTYA